MTKHTPGPWKYSNESVDPNWFIVTAAGGNIVANVNCETGPDIPPLVSIKMPALANAHLIAAAPDLLEALTNLLDMITDNRLHGPEVLAAAEAIHKAESEAPS